MIVTDAVPAEDQIVRIFMQPGEKKVGTHARFVKGYYIVPPHGPVQYELNPARIRGWRAPKGLKPI